MGINADDDAEPSVRYQVWLNHSSLTLILSPAIKDQHMKGSLPAAELLQTLETALLTSSYYGTTHFEMSTPTPPLSVNPDIQPSLLHPPTIRCDVDSISGFQDTCHPQE